MRIEIEYMRRGSIEIAEDKINDEFGYDSIEDLVEAIRESPATWIMDQVDKSSGEVDIFIDGKIQR